MKWSYRTWYGHTLKRNVWSWNSIQKTGLTYSTNSSTVLQPRSLYWTTRSPVDCNSKGMQGRLRKGATRNTIFHNPSQNLRNTLPVIPIILTIPVFHNPVSPISPVEAAVPTSYKHHSIQWKSTKAERQLAMHPLRQQRPHKLPLYQVWQVQHTWPEFQQ